jgi:hypothetical protein
MKLAVLSIALYFSLLRRPILNWGANATEASARLPGDELLEHADGVATRAIWIDAPPSAVWPWLAQIGPAPRGGAYTYDWIENLLGLDMHSVDRILPDFQHPRAGDTIGLGPNRMRLERVEPAHVLSWRSEDGNWVWSFILDSVGDRTRLISRNRFRLPTFTARLGMLPMEPASLVMERKMLRGVKQRAERSYPGTHTRDTQAAPTVRATSNSSSGMGVGSRHVNETGRSPLELTNCAGPRKTYGEPTPLSSVRRSRTNNAIVWFRRACCS